MRKIPFGIRGRMICQTERLPNECDAFSLHFPVLQEQSDRQTPGAAGAAALPPSGGILLWHLPGPCLLQQPAGLPGAGCRDLHPAGGCAAGYSPGVFGQLSGHLAVGQDPLVPQILYVTGRSGSAKGLLRQPFLRNLERQYR